MLKFPDTWSNSSINIYILPSFLISMDKNVLISMEYAICLALLSIKKYPKMCQMLQQMYQMAHQMKHLHGF